MNEMYILLTSLVWATSLCLLYWHEDKCGSAAKIEMCICTEGETMKLHKAHQNEEWQLHYEDISRGSREMSLSEYFLLASSTLCLNARHFHFTSQPQAHKCGDVC